jgi:hypothetical protein
MSKEFPIENILADSSAQVAQARAVLERFKSALANPVDALERGVTDALMAAHAEEVWGRVHYRASHADVPLLGLSDLRASIGRQLEVLTRAPALGASPMAQMSRLAHLAALQRVHAYLEDALDGPIDRKPAIVKINAPAG